MPKAAFRDLDLFVGDAKFGFDPLVFATDHRHFGTGFDDFIAELLRVIAQFAVCRKKLGLFEFE